MSRHSRVSSRSGKALLLSGLTATTLAVGMATAPGAEAVMKCLRTSDGEMACTFGSDGSGGNSYLPFGGDGSYQLIFQRYVNSESEFVRTDGGNATQTDENDASDYQGTNCHRLYNNGRVKIYC